MPRTPIQYQLMKDERKLSILESALPLFATHGKDSVSIDMICKRAQCSHGLFYHYFKNSEQIYNELLKSDNYIKISGNLIPFSDDKDAFSQLVETSKKLLSYISGDKTVLSFLLLVISDSNKKSFTESFTKLISRGQKEGTVTGGNSSDIASVYILFFKGLFLTYLNEKHPAIRMPSIDNVIQIFER